MFALLVILTSTWLHTQQSRITRITVFSKVSMPVFPTHFSSSIGSPSPIQQWSSNVILSANVSSSADICGRIHEGTLLAAWNHVGHHHSLPSQGDGQTEQVNQELGQYLWLFINQRQNNWTGLLPLAEFQYNNHVHSSTQHSTFLHDTGQEPHMGF